MNRWGLDKPDLRFGMEIIDFKEAVQNSGFEMFEKAIADKHIIKGLVVPGGSSFSRAQIDELAKFTQTFHVNNLLTFKVKGTELQGSAVKKIHPDTIAKIYNISQAKDNDLIIFCIESANHAHRALGELRKLLGKKLNLIDKTKNCFLWVTDFPLFEWDEEQKRWAPMHHMFTMPNLQCIDTMEQNPEEVTGQLYDLVLNGVELGSGSIRITSPELQKRIMKMIGMSLEDAEKRFGFLLHAYEYAAPVHGGMGIGLDNLTMTLLGLENIRDAIVFPNASNGMNLHDGSPAFVEQDQLNELHIVLKLPEKQVKTDKE
jgi:aspartyl-tRNA synthetase